MGVPATYYDGHSAAALPATLESSGGLLHLALDNRRITVDKDKARLLPPVGRGAWVIEMDGGQRVQFEDEEFGQALAEHFGHTRFVHHLEKSWHWAMIALVVAVSGTWAILTFGVPVAARAIAFSLPPDIERTLSEESIGALDGFIFEPSELNEEQTSHVTELFREIRAQDPAHKDFRIQFRDSDVIGANAFAIPGGLVVVTDDMVELVESDAEIIAVLAHEVGHLAQHHSLRIILQDSASAIIIAGLTGDLSNITALSAAVPTLLMQSKYSRDFEREADEFAFDYLEREGIDTDVLSDLLLRLESQRDDAEVDGGILEWISSHPQSESRVAEDEEG